MGAPLEESLTTLALPRVDYRDVYSAAVAADATLESVARRLFSGGTPRLMRLRDALVRPLGLKTSPRGAPQPPSFEPGARVGIFTVFARSQDEVLFGEDDHHLDFRLCLRLHPDRRASLTTLVHFGNVWGRAYFLCIRPFHALVVKRMLRRLSGADRVRL